jgi:uncharacterized OB-fold protein
MSKDIFKPIKSIAIKPFWEGITNHQFLYQECNNCEEKFFPPRNRCPKCMGNEFKWNQHSGKGIIHSWSRLEFPVRTPYHIGVIDLEDNLGRILCRIKKSERKPKIGDLVEICYFDFKNEPMFEFRII